MALSTETQEVLAKIDAATNAIAARIQALIDLAASQGSVTEAEVRAALADDVDKLTALGKEPEVPA